MGHYYYGRGSRGNWRRYVFGGEYADKVLSTATANLIAYWPLWEASGSTADNYEGTAARDGSYTGVTLGQAGIGDGRTCPLFDGTNDYVDIYTTSFRDAFDGGEFTASLWARVYDSGVWTDGDSRWTFRLEVDSSNMIHIRQVDNNQLDYRYEAGNTRETIAKADITTTGWMHLALTASATADEVKAYYGGSQEGSTQTGLGTWAGNLDANKTVIGAVNDTPASAWHGYLAHIAIWATPLTAAEISNLSTV
jgi:hypothetical protein